MHRLIIYCLRQIRLIWRPEPYRGKRNCSLYLNYVAEEIARIKKISYEEVVETTKKNAQELFGVK